MAAKGKSKVVDPVEEAGGGEERLPDEFDSLDPAKQPKAGEDSDYLDAKEVGAIQPRAATAPHPFNGYRLGRPVAVGDDGVLKVSSTYIVLLKPTEEPPPDPSNDKVSIYKGGGGQPQTGTETIVTLGTYHTRVVTSRQGNVNEQVVFDRDILVSGSWYKCAVVKGHAARSQILFTFDERRNAVVPDKRYMLADKRQAVPLARMFEAVYNQRTRAERAAKAFDNAQETTA
jgi:hypothetical protein